VSDKSGKITVGHSKFFVELGWSLATDPYLYALGQSAARLGGRPLMDLVTEMWNEVDNES